MIFQLSDWFPKPMIWAIIVKFDQIRKNWWRISCAEILKVGKNLFAASSVKKMLQFEEVSPEKIKKIAWKFTKTVILLGLAGYELIITNSASLVIYISSYLASNSLDFFGWNLLKSWHFLYRRRRQKIFSDLQNFSTRNSPSVFPYLVKLNDNGSYHGLREPIRKLENHYPELKIY